MTKESMRPPAYKVRKKFCGLEINFGNLLLVIVLVCRLMKTTVSVNVRKRGIAPFSCTFNI